MFPLLTFTGLFVLVYAGEPVKYGFLLIYMEEHLKLSPAVRGAVIGIQPFIELLIMPFSIGLGRKLGNVWLMCIAASIAVFANLCFALWSSAIFMSSTALASALGGIAGGFGVAFLGFPNVFLLPALFAGVAVVGLAVMARTESFRVH